MKKTTAYNIKYFNVHLLLTEKRYLHLAHGNLMIIKEVMDNFLTRSVRIQVQNNQNKSRDSPPCHAFIF